MTSPLSDNQVHDRLSAAADLLGDELAETIPGQTALDAARQALRMLALGLLVTVEKDGVTLDMTAIRLVLDLTEEQSAALTTAANERLAGYNARERLTEQLLMEWLSRNSYLKPEHYPGEEKYNVLPEGPAEPSVTEYAVAEHFAPEHSMAEPFVAEYSVAKHPLAISRIVGEQKDEP